MAYKFLVFGALVAAANAGLIGAPIAQTYSTGPVVSNIGIGAPLGFARAAPLGYGAPLGLARASLGYSAPYAVAHAPVAVARAAPVALGDEYDPNPQYSFGYDVQDALTGDNKNQVESRNGDVVQGSYSLNDPDGTRRTVEYTADPINGFNAVVHKQPLVQKSIVAAAPVLRAAPVARIASPIGLSSGLGYAASPIGYSAGYIH